MTHNNESLPQLSESSSNSDSETEQWTDGAVSALENLFGETEQQAKETTDEPDDEFTCESGLCVRCVRNDPASTTKATLDRYCPYCNGLIRVCADHNRCYTPHSKAICSIKGVPYRDGRLIKKPNAYLTELITIAVNDGFYFQAPMKTECASENSDDKKCEVCLKWAVKETANVVRFCPQCARQVDVCEKHQRAATPHQNCENERLEKPKNRYLRKTPLL